MFVMFPSNDGVRELPKWDGNIIRKGNHGFSGTHQSIVLMAEELVRRNYNVFVACGSCNEGVVNGVEYIDFAKIDRVSNQIHILVITPWTPDSILDNNWESLRRCVLWCHLKQIFLTDRFIPEFYKKYPKCKLYCNFITDFVGEHFSKYQSHLSKYFVRRFETIHNPILLDMAHKVDTKDPRSFIFHASFERGGALACRAYDGLNFPDKSMTICSYVPEDIANTDGYTIGTKNKRELFQTLARTEYFIYPGVSSKTHVLTKETDSCVVAEALLHEVIVLAFPVGAMRQNYDSHIMWIPFPSRTYMPSIADPKDSREPELLSNEVVNSIQSIIYDLDANPTKKEEIRKRGKEHVLHQRNLSKITDKFLAFLNK
jgi:hypothetical protein